ncbi:transcription factor bHLH144-like [Panicum virgatum]|uniref:BHLH domain-containing protein n=1 Tax=Panicum virgatum TaxID=38727 RepID=A0A8T0WZL7_PANVG|nr:transcription factor bHLH144-like [Panicum virgatum]XP_039789395.1 transcription factor bHLH144-like [Panicum virgatum]KAG2650564.1 hypothetical protein PVAP13_1NG176500 [Panicum virgatum]
MQGAHGYGGYGYGGYGYDAGAYSSAGGGYGYGYGAGAYGSAGGGYGYDAGAYGSVGGGYGYDAGGYYYSSAYPPAPAHEDPLAAGRRAHDVPASLNGLELQPSEACPRNYVIFDQTCTKSRVMFHPSLAHKLGGPSSGHGGGSCYGAGDGAGKKGACREGGGGGGCSVRQKEDTEEIDALLSSEDDDDVVSTGRTPGASRDDGSSPDSTCSSSRRGGEPRKKERMSKMMRTLRGIVPGGSQMDAPAVLDGAVRYLKSLKVEAKKLGVRGSGS